MNKLGFLWNSGWKKVIWACLVSLVSTFIVSWVLFISLLFFGLFAMGCGASCRTSYLPLVVLVIAVGVFVFTLFFEYKLVRKILNISSLKAVVWVILSLILIPIFSYLVSSVTFSKASKYAGEASKEINAPFLYAQTIRPKIKIVSVAKMPNNEEGKLTGVDVKMEVSAENGGDVEVIGNLVDYNLDDGFQILSHRVPRSSQKITIGKFPVEINLRIMAEYSESDTVDLAHFDMLRINMFYTGRPADYSESANLENNPVDNLSDSGESILKVFPSSDTTNRDLLYVVDLNSGQ